MRKQSWAISGLALLSMTTEAYGGDLRVNVTDSQGAPRQNVVIELISPVVPLPADWPMTGVMDQVNKEFVGPVLAVVAGSTVSFPNSDNVHHHVYSFSPAKRFELPLYTGNTAAPILFENPGIVTIGCNIHDWMVGYIYVGRSHLITVTDADGVGHLSQLPAGTYTANIWHAGLGPDEATPQFDISVTADGVTQHTVSLPQQPARELRRSPLPGMRQY